MKDDGGDVHTMNNLGHRLRVAAVGAVLALSCFLLGWQHLAKRVDPSFAALAIASARSAAAASFACGKSSCDHRTSYCETINTDVPALPSNYACRPLPSGCLPRAGSAAPGCECFPPRTRGDYCSAQTVDGKRVFYRTTIGGH